MTNQITSPLGSNTPERGRSPVRSQRISPWLRWAVQPSSALKLLLVPVVLYANWEFLAPYLSPGASNPFGSVFLLSGRLETSPHNDPRYAKTWWDLAFLVYYIVFWSFVRQSLAAQVFQPLARYFRLKKPAKVERFCEQGYALVYFGFFGTWGYVSLTKLVSCFFRVSNFFKIIVCYDPASDLLVPHRNILDWSVVHIPFPYVLLTLNLPPSDYPHWDMRPGLKRYYLMQLAYWCQQLIVLVLGLEKPRKDYNELVAHHIVTLWLVGYVFSLTFIYIPPFSPIFAICNHS